jgi:hypothetical protein
MQLWVPCILSVIWDMRSAFPRDLRQKEENADKPRSKGLILMMLTSSHLPNLLTGPLVNTIILGLIRPRLLRLPLQLGITRLIPRRLSLGLEAVRLEVRVGLGVWLVLGGVHGWGGDLACRANRRGGEEGGAGDALGGGLEVSREHGVCVV